MAIYGNMVVPSKAAGGALPTDNSDRNVYVPGTEVSARYSDAGGVLAAQGAQKAAEGLGNLGKGLGALGGMGLAFYTRQRRIEHAEAMEAVARLQTEYIEKQREWSQIKGANAIGMEELKSRWWDEAIPRYTEGLSDYGKRYFNLNADRVGAMADTFIQNHQEREIGQYEGQQLKLAMDAEGNMVASNPFDPAAAAASQGRIRGLIHQEAMRKGWTPEMEEQAFLAASGKAWGNAIAVRISMGDFEGANRLMMQYGASVPPEDQAKLRQSWSAGKMGLLAAYAGAGKVDAIRRELDGNGAQSLNARLEFGAGATLGEKYTWGKNDCSGHTCQIWQAALGDSPAKTAIFGRDGAHTTAAEIMRNAYNYTHKLYQGAEINPTSVKGGWLLATTGQNHAVREGRWNNIGHIVTTYEKGDGSIWVSEASSTSGQVTRMPLQQWLASQKRPLLGVDLSSLQPGQVGALPGGYKGVPSGAPYAGGKVHDISATVVGQIVSEAQTQGVNPAQVLAVCQIESSGNMNNRTGNYHGLFQLSEGDTRTFGKPGDDRHDQATNIRVGIAQWKRCMQEMGNNELWACVAYNRGIGAAKKWVQAGADVSKLPKETQDYLKNYERYMAGMPANIGNGGSVGAQSQSPSQPVQTTPAVKMSKEAKETYDAWKGMNLNPAQLMEMAQGMASSSDKVKSQRGKEILAALQSEQQAQAGAPSQAPAPASAQGTMPQAGAQQAQGMGAGFGLTEAERQRVQNDLEPQAHANDIWKRLEVLPLEQLDAGLARELDAFSDNPTLQAKISHYLANNVSNRKKTLEAESKQRVADCAANIKSDNYLGAANTVSQLVANKKISEKEGALALELAFGKKEDNLKSRSAASQVLEDIDRGNITSRQQIEAACLAGRCTEEQTKKCLDYFDKGGQKGQVKWERINSIWKDWKESQGQSVGTGEKIPWELANYVYADMTPGKIPSSEEIRKSIAEGMTKGRGWGSNYAYKAWAKKNEEWEVDELPPAFNGDRKEYWRHVDKWILANVSGITEDDITDPMRRAAAREMTGMPRWGFDWSKVNKGGSR